MKLFCLFSFFFFFNDTATTEIYTLSLHDALPILPPPAPSAASPKQRRRWSLRLDRKSTRLNSSHTVISYAVFCLKKKKDPQRPGRGQGRPPRQPAVAVDEVRRGPRRAGRGPGRPPRHREVAVDHVRRFFFNDPATTEIYTLSLHDALPICVALQLHPFTQLGPRGPFPDGHWCNCHADRKSTRLNSSHTVISYAVFCLKKKKTSDSCRRGQPKRQRQDCSPHA